MAVEMNKNKWGSKPAGSDWNKRTQRKRFPVGGLLSSPSAPPLCRALTVRLRGSDELRAKITDNISTLYVFSSVMNLFPTSWLSKTYTCQYVFVCMACCAHHRRRDWIRKSRSEGWNRNCLPFFFFCVSGRCFANCIHKVHNRMLFTRGVGLNICREWLSMRAAT